MAVLLFVVLTSAVIVAGQRPFYAGSKPIGVYVPEKTTTTTTENIGDRLGENGEPVQVTTQRLPIEANGDKDLVDRLSQLPIDNQPFWLINWQALEKHRENQQTYPQKPNPFINPITPLETPNIVPNVNSNSGFSNTDSKLDTSTVSSSIADYVLNSNINNFISTSETSANTNVKTTTETSSAKVENNISVTAASSIPSSDLLTDNLTSSSLPATNSVTLKSESNSEETSTAKTF